MFITMTLVIGIISAATGSNSLKNKSIRIRKAYFKNVETRKDREATFKYGI